MLLLLSVSITRRVYEAELRIYSWARVVLSTGGQCQFVCCMWLHLLVNQISAELNTYKILKAEWRKKAQKCNPCINTRIITFNSHAIPVVCSVSVWLVIFSVYKYRCFVKLQWYVTQCFLKEEMKEGARGCGGHLPDVAFKIKLYLWMSCQPLCQWGWKLISEQMFTPQVEGHTVFTSEAGGWNLFRIANAAVGNYLNQITFFFSFFTLSFLFLRRIYQIQNNCCSESFALCHFLPRASLQPISFLCYLFHALWNTASKSC